MSIEDYKIYSNGGDEIFAFHIKDVFSVNSAIEFCEAFEINCLITLEQLPVSYKETLDKLELMLFYEIKSESYTDKSWIGEFLVVHIKYFQAEYFSLKNVRSMSQEQMKELLSNFEDFIR